MYRIGQREAKIPPAIVAERSTARSYMHKNARVMQPQLSGIQLRAPSSLSVTPKVQGPGFRFLVQLTS